MNDASPHPEPVASTSAAPHSPSALAASSPSTSSKPPGDLQEGMEEEVPECTICYESSPVTWGILDCCDHHFCYACIRAWQNVNEQGEWNDSLRREEPQAELSLEDAQAKNACPVCRRKIYLVMPTPKLFDTKEEKEEAFEVYEDGLSETPCRALMASDPDFPYCPRGRECPYSHTHHGTGYHYTFSHTHTEHLLAVQRLSHERQAQHFMLALLSSGGLLASSILPTLPLLPNGVRNVVEELAGLVRDGEMGRFRSRIGELGNEGEWRRSVTERMWVGEGEEPTGEDDEGEGWYDEVDEEDEAEDEDVSQGGWVTDEDAEEADEDDGLPDVEPLRAYSLGRAVGARDRERERRRAVAEDEEGDSDGLPPLEAIDGSDLEEESSEDQEEMDDDDLPPLEEIDVDDLPPAPRSAPSPSIPSESSASSDYDSDSGSASSVYEDADSDLDPLPPRPSSSSAPTASPAPSIPASVSFASTFSSAFPSPRPLTPAAAPSVFPPSIATSGPSPAAAAQNAVQHLRSSLSRPSHSASSATSAQQPAEEPSEEEEESEEEPDSDDSIAAEHAALARQYARAERLFELAQEETNPIRRAALEREAVRLYGANDWVSDGGNGMEEWREGGSDGEEGEEESSEGGEEEANEVSSEEEDDSGEEQQASDGSASHHSDASSTDDDTHDRPSAFIASSSVSSSRPAPPHPSASFDAPPPAPIRSMSRWSSSSTTLTATTSTRTRPPVDPAQREMEKRRRRAAQAAERRRAEEKWEEMD